MGALYPLGAGTRQLRALSLAGQCRSNRSQRSVEGSRLISSSLSRHGMYSLMLSGQTGNLPIRTLFPPPAPAPPGSCGAASSVARSVSLAPAPTSKSSRIAPSSPTRPRRAGGGGGRGRGGGSVGVGGGSECGDEALGVGEAGGAAGVGIRDGSKERLELAETATEGAREALGDEEEADEKKRRRGEASDQW